MYRKKDRKVMVIAAAVVIIFIAVIYIVPNFGEIFRREEEPETEPSKYEVLIHKTDAGRIDVRKSFLKSDSGSETRLEALPGTLVSLNITPKKNKVLTGVLVVDSKDFNNQFGTIINETKENTYTVDFSMPDRDVVMTFTFETREMPETQKEEIRESEIQKESESEQTSPYGLRLHGVTADIITSYNGQFDDDDFLNQLGDTLHLDSPRSEYYGITDVTFSRDPYEGEAEVDKVFHYIYFGEDPEWKMLSTYYMKDHSYVFTKYVKAPEESEASGGSAAQASTTQGGSFDNGSGSYIQAPSVETSLDILAVSKVFLDYVGGKEAFYQKAFDYVLSRGLTGEITGTMSSYDIDPKKKRATITILLDNGSSFTGTYRKDKKSFSFSGL